MCCYKDLVFNFSKYRDKRVDLNLLFEIAIIIFIWDGYKYCKFPTEINQVSIFYFLPVLKHIYPFSFISFNFLTNFLTNIFYDQLFFFLWFFLTKGLSLIIVKSLISWELFVYVSIWYIQNNKHLIWKIVLFLKFWKWLFQLFYLKK